MKDFYNKAHDYIASNQSIIDLIERETVQLEKDITAMWIAGYVQRELEKYTGRKKFDDENVGRLAIESLCITQSIDKHWVDFSKFDSFLINAYKVGYNTRDNEG